MFSAWQLYVVHLHTQKERQLPKKNSHQWHYYKIHISCLLQSQKYRGIVCIINFVSIRFFTAQWFEMAEQRIQLLKKKPFWIFHMDKPFIPSQAYVSFWLTAQWHAHSPHLSLLLIVSDFMSLPSIPSVKTLFAVLAPIWHHPSMNPVVYPQLIHSSKGFATFCALKFLF